MNIENDFLNTQSPLNEDDNSFDGKLKDINYKRTVRKLHYAGLEKQFFTFADVSMLGYGCGVSQYPQFYDKGLDRYQMLPHTYRVYFEGFPGDSFLKEKWLLYLVHQAKNVIWEIIEKSNKEILVSSEGKTNRGKRNPTVKIQNWENFLYFHGCHWR